MCGLSRRAIIILFTYSPLISTPYHLLSSNPLFIVWFGECVVVRITVHLNLIVIFSVMNGVNYDCAVNVLMYLTKEI